MEVRSDVRSVHDLGKPHERGIIKEIVLEHDTFERTATIHVAQFGAFDVERDCPFPLGDLHDFACRDEEEFGIRVNESPDQPGTGDAIDLGIFTSNPFHDSLPHNGVDVLPHDHGLRSPSAVTHENPIHVRGVVDTPDSPLAGDLLEELARLQFNDVEAVVDRVRHERPASFRADRQVVQPADRALQSDRPHPLQGRVGLGRNGIGGQECRRQGHRHHSESRKAA